MTRIITPDWTVDDTPIICSEPIDSLIDEMRRRHRERAEERPGEEPTVASSWILDRLTEARRKAVKLDRWLTIAQIMTVVNDVSERTVRRRVAEMPEGQRRTNDFSGKIEVHVEAVAEKLGLDAEELRAAF